ncbi:MAG: GGDEF domain-containing protein [Lachnospiraceae bacterium]|nr:GGDEF domain-containing protein [Lachnospiraceae bacterium]
MSLPETKQKDFENTIYISGTITEQMMLVDHDSYAARYIDIEGRPIANLPICEDDYDAFKAMLERANANGKASGYMRVLAVNGEYRHCFMLIDTPVSGRDGKAYPFRLVDLEHAQLEFPRLAGSLASIYRMYEAGGIMLLEYIVKDDSMSVSSFRDGKQIPLDDEDINEACRTIVKKVSNINANVEHFVENIIVNGRYFQFEGSIIYENLERSKMIAMLRERRNKNVDDDVSYRNMEGKYDSFTGLYNKVSALSYAKEIIETKKYNQVIMIMLDIDNFKMVNDTYGHAFGDEVIKTLAIILRDIVKGYGIAARFGGDEFFLVLHDIGDETAVRSICETIESKFRWAYAERLGSQQPMTSTMGLSEYPRNGEDFDILYRKADKALYIGKQKGRHRYIIYKEAIHGELDLNEETTGTVARITGGEGSAAIIKTISKVTENLWRNGVSNLVNSLANLLPALGISGISIYGGKNLDAEYHIGSYICPPQHMNFVLDPSVIKHFNDGGWFKINLSSRNELWIDGYYEYLKEHEIMITYQYIIGTKDDVQGLVTFDVQTRARENSVGWSDDVVRFMAPLVQLIGVVLK